MDEWEELGLVHQVLNRFATVDRKWESNYFAFDRMLDTQRHRWWQLAKKQADKGLPSMQRLLLEVIKLRMQS